MYQIAIPSYKRASCLANNTLAFLQSMQVLPERITIFVSGDEEKAAYEKAFKGAGYNIISGPMGLGAMRGFMQDNYMLGARVLFMDDDIQGIFQSNDGKKLVPITPQGFEQLLDQGFAVCRLYNAHLWGIYPVANAFFFNKVVSTDLRYIVGAFYGLVITHANSTYVTLDDKEDFERSILYYLLDAHVIRFNDVCVKTRYYTEPGGMQEYRTEETVSKGAATLLARYPQLCQPNKARKQHVEIKLRDQRRRAP